MKPIKTLTAALCTAGLLGLSAPANAVIVLNSWQIDLGAIGAVTGGDDFTGLGVFGKHHPSGTVGIDQMQFQALYHAVTLDKDGNGFVTVGDKATVDTLGLITSANNSSGPVLRTTTDKFLNDAFELTFVATTTQLVTSNPAPNGLQSNRHLAANCGADCLVGYAVGPDGVTNQNGYLNVFADVIDGPGDKVGTFGNTNPFSAGGGSGILDGLLIAVFEVLPAATNSGSFNLNPDSLDGADDATFKLVWQYEVGGVGIWKDKDGNPLPLGSTLAFTDSNFDADPDSNKIIDTNIQAKPAGGMGPCGTTAFNNCGQEDGTFVLAVPEPATLAMLGLGLLGLGLARRRG